MNRLRSIIRQAMNDTKVLEWSPDEEVAHQATVVWAQLEEIFQLIGYFEEEERQDG